MPTGTIKSFLSDHHANQRFLTNTFRERKYRVRLGLSRSRAGRNERLTDALMPRNAINAPTQPWQNVDKAWNREQPSRWTTWTRSRERRRNISEYIVGVLDESVSVERVLRYYGSPVSDALKCKNTLKSIVCVDDTGFSKRAVLSFLSLIPMVFDGGTIWKIEKGSFPQTWNRSTIFTFTRSRGRHFRVRLGEWFVSFDDGLG